MTVAAAAVVVIRCRRRRVRARRPRSYIILIAHVARRARVAKPYNRPEPPLRLSCLRKTRRARPRPVTITYYTAGTDETCITQWLIKTLSSTVKLKTPRMLFTTSRVKSWLSLSRRKLNNRRVSWAEPVVCSFRWPKQTKCRFRFFPEFLRFVQLFDF